MDWLTILTFSIPLISLIVSIANIIIERFIKSKKSYYEMKINDKKIRLMYNSNMAVLLDGIEPFLKAGEIQEGLVLKIINEYIFKLSNALNDFYSKCAFDISVKRFDKNSNTIYTIASTDRALSIMDNNIMYTPEENTEFNSILNEHYEYFFVSDIDDFDELIMPYKSSNANWKSFYRSSIVVPITKKQEPFSHIIGFICITSPQSLNNTTKNRKIISLLRATSNELYEILVKMPYSM